jgi:hypothetical protein
MTTLVIISILSILMGIFIWKYLPFELAKRDIFCTFVEEGQYKAVFEGGSFKKFVYRVAGYKLDKNYDKTPLGDANPEYLGPIAWLGWPGIGKVFTYPFTFTKRIQQENGTYQEVSRTLEVKSLFDEYTYFNKWQDIEMAGGFKVTTSVNISIRIKNPYKVLFVQLPSGNWLNILWARLIAKYGELGQQKGFEELSKDRHILAEELQKIACEDIGIDIVQVTLIDFEYQEPEALRLARLAETAKKEEEARTAQEEAAIKTAEALSKKLDVLMKNAEKQALIDTAKTKKENELAVEKAKKLSQISIEEAAGLKELVENSENPAAVIAALKGQFKIDLSNVQVLGGGSQGQFIDLGQFLASKKGGEK